MRPKSRLFWALACAVAFSLTAAAAEHNKVTAEFHQTYPFSATGRLDLENLNGAVHITAWDRNEIKVDAIKTAFTQARLDEAKIEVNASKDERFHPHKISRSQRRLGRTKSALPTWNTRSAYRVRFALTRSNW